MITSDDITGVEESVARRVFVYARSIAPCLSDLEDDAAEDAIAILQGVALEVAARGSRDISSQRIGAAAVTYRDVASCFNSDDRSALRALCGAPAGSALPVGSFPASGSVSSVWPEGTYS